MGRTPKAITKEDKTYKQKIKEIYERRLYNDKLKLIGQITCDYPETKGFKDEWIKGYVKKSKITVPKGNNVSLIVTYEKIESDGKIYYCDIFGKIVNEKKEIVGVKSSSDNGVRYIMFDSIE
jgi:hypothetical protein